MYGAYINVNQQNNSPSNNKELSVKQNYNQSMNNKIKRVEEQTSPSNNKELSVKQNYNQSMNNKIKRVEEQTH